MPQQLQILVDSFIKSVGQKQVAPAPALFPDPYQPAG